MEVANTRALSHIDLVKVVKLLDLCKVAIDSQEQVINNLAQVVGSPAQVINSLVLVINSLAQVVNNLAQVVNNLAQVVNNLEVAMHINLDTFVNIEVVFIAQHKANFREGWLP